MEPDALAPTSSAQFQWPRWGQFIETSGREGERPALPEVNELVRLYEEWRVRFDPRPAPHHLAQDAGDQCRAALHNRRDQQHAAADVVAKDMRNVPDVGLYSFEPGAFIGRYMPDTFWFDRQDTAQQAPKA